MDRKIIAGVIGAIILISVIVLAFSSSTNATKTYSGNGISYNYTDNWDFSKITSNETISMSTSDDENNFAIWIKNSNNTIDDAYDIWYSVASEEGTIISNENITVDGVKAIKISNKRYYEGSYAEQEVIVLEKNGKEYTLLFTSRDLDSIRSDINTILNSFKTT